MEGIFLLVTSQPSSTLLGCRWTDMELILDCVDKEPAQTGLLVGLVLPAIVLSLSLSLPPAVCSYFFSMIIPIDPLPFTDGVGLNCCLRSHYQSQGGMTPPGGLFAARLRVVKHTFGLPSSAVYGMQGSLPVMLCP